MQIEGTQFGAGLCPGPEQEIEALVPGCSAFRAAAHLETQLFLRLQPLFGRRGMSCIAAALRVCPSDC